MTCCAGSWKAFGRADGDDSPSSSERLAKPRPAPSISNAADDRPQRHAGRPGCARGGNGRARGRSPAPAPARQELHQPDQAEVPGAGGEVDTSASRSPPSASGWRPCRPIARNQKRMNARWRSSDRSTALCPPCMRAEASRCTPGLPASVAASSAAATSSAAIGRMPRGTSGSTGRATGSPTLAGRVGWPSAARSPSSSEGWAKQTSS